MKKYLFAFALLSSFSAFSAELKLFHNYVKVPLANKDKVFVAKILQEIDFDEVAMDLMVNVARNGLINKYESFCKKNEFGGDNIFTTDLLSGKFDSYFRNMLTNSNGPDNAKEFVAIFLSVVGEPDRNELLKLGALKSKFVNKLIVGYYLNTFIASQESAFKSIGNSFYAEHCASKVIN